MNNVNHMVSTNSLENKPESLSPKSSTSSIDSIEFPSIQFSNILFPTSQIMHDHHSVKKKLKSSEGKLFYKKRCKTLSKYKCIY